MYFSYESGHFAGTYPVRPDPVCLFLSCTKFEPKRKIIVQVRHLSYFVTLAREKHFSRTADICHVAQPTLSAAIRNLEEELEVRLIARGHRFLKLTPEGERVLIWARQILKDYEGLREDLAAQRKGLQGFLKLGAIPSTMPMVSLISSLFQSEHPGALFDIQSMSSRSIQRRLNAFEIDAGLTYLENEPLENVRKIPLYREHYVFATAKDGPLAGRSSITWAEAAKEKLCLLSDDMQNRRILNAISLSAGVVIFPDIVSNSFLGICSHIKQGPWSSIVPHTFSSLFGKTTDVMLIDLVEPTQDQAVGLVLSDRDPLSPMASALLTLSKSGDLARVFASVPFRV